MMRGRIRHYCCGGVLFLFVLIALTTVCFATAMSSELSIGNLGKFTNLSVDVNEELVVGKLSEKIKQNQKLLISVNGIEQRINVSNNGEFVASLKYRKGVNLVHFRYGMKEKYFWKMSQCHSAGYLTVGIDRETLELNEFVEIVFKGYPQKIAKSATVAILKAYEVRVNGKIPIEHTVGIYPLSNRGKSTKAITDVLRQDFSLPSEKLIYGIELQNSNGEKMDSFYLEAPLVQKVVADSLSTQFYTPFFDPKEVYLTLVNGNPLDHPTRGPVAYVFDIPSMTTSEALQKIDVILGEKLIRRKETITIIPPSKILKNSGLVDMNIEVPNKGNTLLQTQIKGEVLFSVPEQRWVEIVINGKSHYFDLDNRGNFSGPVQVKDGYDVYYGFYGAIPTKAVLYNGKISSLILRPGFSEDLKSLDAFSKVIIPITSNMRFKSPTVIKLQVHKSRELDSISTLETKDLMTLKLIKNKNYYETETEIDLRELYSEEYNTISADVVSSTGEKLETFEISFSRNTAIYDTSSKQYKIAFLQKGISSIAMKTESATEDLFEYLSNGILSLDERLFVNKKGEYDLEYTTESPGIKRYFSLQLKINHENIEIR